MNPLLYLAFLGLGFVGGILVCLPIIVKLKAFRDKFSGKRARDKSGRFVSARAEMTAVLRAFNAARD